MSDINFKCAKCGGLESETGTIRTTGGGFTRYMNLQNNKVGYVACTNSGFCDFYRDFGKDKGWQTVLGIFTN